MTVESEIGEVAGQPQQAEEAQRSLLSLHIVRAVHEAQQQHGLRHGDHQRYRGYCSRRLRRLRRALHVPQGDRRHYRRRDVTAAALAAPSAEPRLLALPLVQAERAWAHAMQLRREANTEPRKRFHLVRRLRKASAHALQLLALADAGACARTRLEAQAYSAGMEAALHLELSAWTEAQAQLSRAQLVYAQLAQILPEEERALYAAKAEELQPALRYCAYNAGDASAAADLQRLPLADHIRELMAQARGADGDAHELQWRGRRVLLRTERARLALAAIEQLDATLAAITDLSEQVAHVERVLADCKEAAGGEKGEALTYLAERRLRLTVRRNLLLVRQAAGAPHAHRARLYEIVLANYQELQALPGLEDDADFQAGVRAHTLAYRALRLYHIAHVLGALRRHSAALALLERAAGLAADAAAAVGLLEPEPARRIAGLQGEIESARALVHANSVLASGADDTGKAPRARAPVAERLDELQEGTRPAYRLPPQPEPVACKPLLFDLAGNALRFPDLTDKLGVKTAPATRLTGLVKGLLGWGGGSE